MRTYEGNLMEWLETGTEGCVWCLESDTADPQHLLYNHLVILREGHPLLIAEPDGDVIFDGYIQEDTTARWTPSPWQPSLYGRDWLNPKELLAFLLRRIALQSTSWWWIHPQAYEPMWDHYPAWLRRRLIPYMHGQPLVHGLWVHWIQKGWDPREWVRLFLREEGEPRMRGRVMVSESLTHAEQEMLRSTVTIHEYAMVYLRVLQRMTRPSGFIIGGNEYDDDTESEAHAQHQHAVGQLIKSGIDVLTVGKYATTWMMRGLAYMSGIPAQTLRDLRRTFKRKPHMGDELNDFLRLAWKRNHLKHLYRIPTRTPEELYWEFMEIMVCSERFDYLYLLPSASPEAVQLAARARARGLVIAHYSPRR